MSAPFPSPAPRSLPSRPDRDRRHLRPAADRRPARSPRRTSVLQPITILPAAPGTSIPLQIAVRTSAALPVASGTTGPRRISRVCRTPCNQLDLPTDGSKNTRTTSSWGVISASLAATRLGPTSCPPLHRSRRTATRRSLSPGVASVRRCTRTGINGPHRRFGAAFLPRHLPNACGGDGIVLGSEAAVPPADGWWLPASFRVISDEARIATASRPRFGAVLAEPQSICGPVGGNREARVGGGSTHPPGPRPRRRPCRTRHSSGFRTRIAAGRGLAPCSSPPGRDLVLAAPATPKFEIDSDTDPARPLSNSPLAPPDPPPAPRSLLTLRANLRGRRWNIPRTTTVVGMRGRDLSRVLAFRARTRVPRVALGRRVSDGRARSRAPGGGALLSSPAGGGLAIVVTAVVSGELRSLGRTFRLLARCSIPFGGRCVPRCRALPLSLPPSSPPRSGEQERERGRLAESSTWRGQDSSRGISFNISENIVVKFMR